jgi:hypothetical protein
MGGRGGGEEGGEWGRGGYNLGGWSSCLCRETPTDRRMIWSAGYSWARKRSGRAASDAHFQYSHR